MTGLFLFFHIDVAFVPVDPRLGRENQVLAADSCMERLDIGRLYPMHMFGDYSQASQGRKPIALEWREECPFCDASFL